jgi:hypothetical protein
MAGGHLLHAVLVYCRAASLSIVRSVCSTVVDAAFVPQAPRASGEEDHQQDACQITATVWVFSQPVFWPVQP